MNHTCWVVRNGISEPSIEAWRGESRNWEWTTKDPVKLFTVYRGQSSVPFCGQNAVNSFGHLISRITPIYKPWKGHWLGRGPTTPGLGEILITMVTNYLQVMGYSSNFKSRHSQPWKWMSMTHAILHSISLRGQSTRGVRTQACVCFSKNFRTYRTYPRNITQTP